MALNEPGRGAANGGAERDPRLEHLYREAALEAPPPHVDAAILAAARREVGARPRSLDSRLRRWHVPISVAAVVVVSVTLVILMREEEPARRSMQAPVPAAAKRAEEDAAPRTPRAPAAAASEAMRIRPAAPAPQTQELRDEKFAAALGKREDSSRADSGPRASSGEAAMASSEPAAKSAPQPFQAASPGLAEERAAKASADAVVAGRLENVPATASEPDRPISGAPRALSATPEVKARAAGQDRPPVWKGLEKEPPEKWLARIEDLRRQGRLAEAEEMLSEFKRRFPGHPLARDAK